jgi:hypothetical protein
MTKKHDVYKREIKKERRITDRQDKGNDTTGA